MGWVESNQIITCQNCGKKVRGRYWDETGLGKGLGVFCSEGCALQYRKLKEERQSLNKQENDALKKDIFKEKPSLGLRIGQGLLWGIGGLIIVLLGITEDKTMKIVIPIVGFAIGFLFPRMLKYLINRKK